MMFDLIQFELNKVWRKSTFIVTILTLLAINLLLVLYTNKSNGINAELSSYHQFQRDIEGKTEEEKEEYINTLYEDIQGIRVVNDILNYKKMSNEMGDNFVEQMMEENAETYEKYSSIYQSGEYLKYTDSFEKEISFINEIYLESQKVFAYEEYKKEIEERKDMLRGISIFSSGDEDTFSSRNIKKEADDYADLYPANIEFYPSKGVSNATQNDITDILLILSVILFASTLINEEKEKKLFYVTRATKNGRMHYIGSKVIALLVHCLGMTILFYMCNILFFAFSSGIGNLFSSIQSYTAFMESTLSISVLDYIFLLFLTKTMIVFFIGLIVLYIAIKTKQIFMPYLITGGMLIVNAVCYLLIPAQSTINWLKYINIFGLIDVKNLYGSYLNFNILGYPVSRTSASVITSVIVISITVLLTIYAFLKMKNFEISKIQGFRLFKFKPHTSLFRHELYKAFITNKAIIVILFFTFFIGYEHLNQVYNLSPNEIYYQNMMLKLEGKLTTEKESLIMEEKQRYDDAFSEIERIDNMVAQGKLDEKTAESIKTPLYNETAFYSSFQKVLNQYEYVKTKGSSFVYETGYALLFGLIENDRLFDYILLTSCILFMFSSMFAFEYQKCSWNLLSSTLKGRKDIVKKKVYISILAAAFITFVPFLVRGVQIIKYCPMNQISTSMLSLPFFQELDIDLPIIVWIILQLLSEFIVFSGITILVLILSNKLKQQTQVLFFGVLVIVIPPILQVMGFSYFKWISLLPMYNMTSEAVSSNVLGMVFVYGFITMLMIYFGIYYLLNGDKIFKRK